MVAREFKVFLDAFREEYPRYFEGVPDSSVFPAFSSRVLYFDDETKPFDARLFNKAIADGGYDGGIDAVFANPERNTNEIVIIQSKCYCERNDINVKLLGSELNKILGTVGTLTHCGKKRRLNQRTREAYNIARNACCEPDEAEIVVHVVTSWNPKTEHRREKLSKKISAMKKRAAKYGVSDIKMTFGKTILDLAKVFGQEKELVSKGSLQLDRAGNILRNGRTSVVNVRASSIVRLWDDSKRSILGLNLRYHVCKNRMEKDVDNRIQETIESCPENFLLFNNGITIVCERYSVDPRSGRITFKNFSIVNGGQTAFNIHENWDISRSKEYLVQCKIIEIDGINGKTGKDLARKVAESANSQKPIKLSVLHANYPEQKALGNALDLVGVFYERKLGAKPLGAKRYDYVENIDSLGKLGLSGVLLMPAEARNNLPRMFEDAYYTPIFRNHTLAKFYRDLIRLRKCYADFRCDVCRYKTKPRWCEDKEEWQIAKLAETFVISSAVYIKRREDGTIGYQKLKLTRNGGGLNAEKYAALVGRRNDTEVLFADYDEINVDDMRDFFKRTVRAIYRSYLTFKDDYGADQATVPAFLKRPDSFRGYLIEELESCRKKTPYRRVFKRVFE